AAMSVSAQPPSATDATHPIQRATERGRPWRRTAGRPDARRAGCEDEAALFIVRPSLHGAFARLLSRPRDAHERRRVGIDAGLERVVAVADAGRAQDCLQGRLEAAAVAVRRADQEVALRVPLETVASGGGPAFEGVDQRDVLRQDVPSWPTGCR